MTSKREAYLIARKERLAIIEMLEERMVEEYQEYIQDCLTNEQKGVLCSSVETDRVETSRQRNFGEGEDYETTHTFNFEVEGEQIEVEIVYNNSSGRFRGHTAIVMGAWDLGMVVERNEDCNDWFLKSPLYDTPKEIEKNRNELYRRIKSAFEEHSSAVIKCIQEIIRCAPEINY